MMGYIVAMISPTAFCKPVKEWVMQGVNAGKRHIHGACGGRKLATRSN